MRIVLPDSGYSYIASTKKLTLEHPYDELSLGQILSIRNMTTRSLYYDITNPQQNIILVGDEITHDYEDGNRDANDDGFQIIIEDLSVIHDGHLKIVGYHESLGHGSTNDDVVKELATGSKEGISTGAYYLVESDDFVQPGGDVQLYVQSTSVNDTAAGSGAQQLTIVYLSLAWGAKKTQVVTMDGTNQVAIPNIDKYRIHSVEVNRGRGAAGTITITDIGETTLYGGINQYKTYMARCIFYVAEGEIVTAVEAVCSSTTSGGVYVSIFASEEDDSSNVVTRARIPFRIDDATLVMKFELPEAVSNPNNERIAFGAAVTAASGAANQDCEVTLKGYNEPI